MTHAHTHIYLRCVHVWACVLAWHVVINLLATANSATFQNCFASFHLAIFALISAPSMKNELNFAALFAN